MPAKRADEIAAFQKSSPPATAALLLKIGSDDVTINHGDHRDQRKFLLRQRGKPASEKFSEDKQRNPFPKSFYIAHPRSRASKYAE